MKVERTSERIFVTGVSFKTAPVEVRERLAGAITRLDATGLRQNGPTYIAELVLLSTCNRLEFYGATRQPGEPVKELLGLLLPSARDCEASVYTHQGVAAVRHLFAVASGLDSMVVGETEIAGQVKAAYESARAAGLTGALLNRLFQKALQTAKAVRSQTSIGRGATSVASVAVQMLEQIFDAP